MANSSSSSAEAALQGLVVRLRDLRLNTGMTGVSLAAELGWHQSKVSRIESATRAPSIPDVRAWCRACDAEDQAADLVEVLRAVETAYLQWRQLYRAGLKGLQESYVPLHERTHVMRVYSSVVVPGMLQTSAYIEALLTAISRQSNGPNDVPDAVKARVARQRVLYEGDHRFAFLLEEAVLGYGLGGVDVMVEQLEHLLEVMSLSSVSLGIIPASPDRLVWPLETFTMYDTSEVKVELLSARVTITTPSEVRMYDTAFTDLATMAVYGERARELITRMRVEHFRGGRDPG